MTNRDGRPERVSLRRPAASPKEHAMQEIGTRRYENNACGNRRLRV